MSRVFTVIRGAGGGGHKFLFEEARVNYVYSNDKNLEGGEVLIQNFWRTKKGSKNWSLFSSYPNIVPIGFFTSSHSQVGCNKFSSWVTPHIRVRS